MLWPPIPLAPSQPPRRDSAAQGLQFGNGFWLMRQIKFMVAWMLGTVHCGSE